MRATIDTILLTCWGLLALILLTYAAASVAPELAWLLHVAGRLVAVGMPMLSAYRIHCTHDIPRPLLWALGFWLFSLATLAQLQGVRHPSLQQNALVMASALFILIPVPMTRVWRELLKRGE